MSGWDAYVNLIAAEDVCEWGAILDGSTAMPYATSAGLNVVF